MIFAPRLIEEGRKIYYIQYFPVVGKRSVKGHLFSFPPIDAAVRMSERLYAVHGALLYVLEFKSKTRSKLRFKHF